MLGNWISENRAGRTRPGRRTAALHELYTRHLHASGRGAGERADLALEIIFTVRPNRDRVIRFVDLYISS